MADKLKKLTKKEALEIVEHIRNISSDSEVAHEQEDSLYSLFISCVAENMYTKKEAIEIAKIVKSTREIKFGRFYS